MTNSLSHLAARLTKPEDRETYAGLVSYFGSLPEGDEFLKVAELLGLLTLVARDIPDDIAEFLCELRTQAEASASYHRKVDERLAGLPSEIAAHVDAKKIAESMSEEFRQQLVTAGLHDTALLLQAATHHYKNALGRDCHWSQTGDARICEHGRHYYGGNGEAHPGGCSDWGS